MPHLIHLNGPPGIGKSTIARRYAAEHAGVLNCDVDVLRTLIGGWHNDFAAAGELIRPAALAMISAYLANGHDVVLPQMLVRETELERFQAAARTAAAEFIEIVLMDDRDRAVARFHRRGHDSQDPWHEQVRRIVDDNGGNAELTRCHTRLVALSERRPEAVVVASRENAIDATYAAVVKVIGRGRLP